MLLGSRHTSSGASSLIYGRTLPVRGRIIGSDVIDGLIGRLLRFALVDGSMDPVEAAVLPIQGQQFVVGARFDYAALVEHENQSAPLTVRPVL